MQLSLLSFNPTKHASHLCPTHLLLLRLISLISHYSSHSFVILLLTHPSHFIFISFISHTQSFVILEQWPSKWWFSIILARTVCIQFFCHCRRCRRELLGPEWLNESKSFIHLGLNIFRFFELLSAKHIIFFLATQDQTL